MWWVAGIFVQNIWQMLFLDEYLEGDYILPRQIDVPETKENHEDASLGIFRYVWNNREVLERQHIFLGFVLLFLLQAQIVYIPIIDSNMFRLLIFDDMIRENFLAGAGVSSEKFPHMMHSVVSGRNHQYATKNLAHHWEGLHHQKVRKQRECQLISYKSDNNLGFLHKIFLKRGIMRVISSVFWVYLCIEGEKDSEVYISRYVPLANIVFLD